MHMPVAASQPSQASNGLLKQRGQLWKARSLRTGVYKCVWEVHRPRQLYRVDVAVPPTAGTVCTLTRPLLALAAREIHVQRVDQP